MELGLQAAFDVADPSSKPTILTLRPDAVRCAFRLVASIVTVFGSTLVAAGASIMRVNIPIAPQRFYDVSAGS